MILLWGLPRDTPMTAVRGALERLRVPYRFLDQQDVLETEVELSVDPEVRGAIRMPGGSVALEDVTAFYLRPHDSRRLRALEGTPQDGPARRHALLVDDLLQSWAELTPALVINRPSAMASNGSKPYQSMLIRKHGFDVPETLITTSEEAALDFWRSQGEVIYKSISGVRSIVSRLTPAHRDRLEQLRWCPTQFQRCIPGQDYRVHVVGGALFPCVITSEADDYRYASRGGHAVELRPCELPDDVASRCLALSADLGLPVSGIDLRRTPEGRWCCFEVNPSPGFTYFEEATGLPIARAIARLLAGRRARAAPVRPRRVRGLAARARPGRAGHG